MKQDIINRYFFFLFSIIPLSLLVGSAVSAINVLLIAISFLIYSFYYKEWQWLKDTNVKLLIVIYVYLIFNSLISLDFNSGATRNLGFVRFILFFSAFNYFFQNYQKFNKILLIWFVFIFFVVLDVYLESITGKNILGYGGDHHRIESFFKNEQKVGGYIFCFYLLIIGFLLNTYNNKSRKNNYLFLIISIFILVSIIATGERSNALKAILAFLLFFLLCKNFIFKEKIILIVGATFIFGLIYSNSEFIKLRFGKQLFWKIESVNNYIKLFKDSNFDTDSLPNDNFHRSIGFKYFQLYSSAYNVFKKYPYFGVGNKNYRIITCPEKVEDWNPDYVCNSHPHQIYFEFLSEHGIVGTTILLVIFFILIFKILRKISVRNNNIQLGSIIYLSIFFIPILPSGSFFNDYYSTLFWINLSLLYASNVKTNIFKKN